MSTVFLSVLNFTYYCLECFCQYRTLHIAVCGRSVCTELCTLLSTVSLSVLNFSNCCLWCLCRCWIVHIALRCVCRYWTVQFVVFSLSLDPENYTFLFRFSLSVLKFSRIFSCLYFNTDVYILLSVVSLSELTFTHCCVWSLCCYWAVQFAVCGVSADTKQYLLLGLVCLLVLKFTHWSVWTVCIYWTVHMAVGGLSVLKCTKGILWYVCLSVLNRIHCCVCLTVLNCTQRSVWSVCRNWNLYCCVCPVCV